MRSQIHIPCATSGNVQVDCALRRVGDLLRICGYGTMDFIPSDAMDLAKNAALIAVECGYRNPDDIAQVAAFWRKLAVECGWHDPTEDDREMNDWIKTSEQAPHPGKVVLGYWPTVVMQTVVYRDGNYWVAPGYPSSPRIKSPEYWREIPVPPPEYQRGE